MLLFLLSLNYFIFWEKNNTFMLRMNALLFPSHTCTHRLVERWSQVCSKDSVHRDSDQTKHPGSLCSFLFLFFSLLESRFSNGTAQTVVSSRCERWSEVSSVEYQLCLFTLTFMPTRLTLNTCRMSGITTTAFPAFAPNVNIHSAYSVPQGRGHMLLSRSHGCWYVFVLLETDMM